MAYLNGHQDHFTMVGGQESARNTLHLAELFRLADRAGLLLDPARAASRMAAVLRVRGIAQSPPGRSPTIPAWRPTTTPPTPNGRWRSRSPAMPPRVSTEFPSGAQS